ncbi:MAG: hypothetical protein R2710_26395 [Acidimicrobiales bacterium]
MIRGSFAIDPIRGETILNGLNTLTGLAHQHRQGRPERGRARVRPTRRRNHPPRAIRSPSPHPARLRHPRCRRQADITAVADADTLANGFHDHTVAETANGAPIPPPPSPGCAATRSCRPSRSIRSPGRSTSDAVTGSPPTPNEPSYGHCTPPVLSATATHRSSNVMSITSWNGNTAGPPTSPTSVPLCWRHHHLVHEGGWHLMHSVTQPGQLFLTDPGGTVRATCRPTRLEAWTAAKKQRRQRPASNVHRRRRTPEREPATN